MNIDRISRSKSYEMVTPFGLKIWDKLGVEGTLGENEDPKECYKQLGQLIEETHKENVKEMEEFRGTNIKVIEEQVIKSEKTMIEEMEACTTYADIQSFRFTIKNAEEQTVYETKLNEFTPKN